MCIQHTTLKKTLEMSDSICQFLIHHAENISHNSLIGSFCHSGHDGSIHCSTYEIAGGNTLSPPHFMPPHEHWEQGYDGKPTSQTHSSESCVFFHASHLYRSINHDASYLHDTSYLYCSINHDASYGTSPPQSIASIPPAAILPPPQSVASLPTPGTMELALLFNQFLRQATAVQALANPSPASIDGNVDIQTTANQPHQLLHQTPPVNHQTQSFQPQQTLPAQHTSPLQPQQTLQVFTDGDLRRALDAGHDVHTTTTAEVMTRAARTIAETALAAEALRMMEQHRINALLVLDAGRRLVGVLNMHDLLRAQVL